MRLSRRLFPCRGWLPCQWPTLLLFLSLALVRCGTRENPHIVATINNRPITVEEFRLRYDFTPHVEKVESGTNKRYEFLSSLMGEKLLAQYAQDNGWDRDRKVRAQIEEFEKEALVEALLNEKILKNIKISDTEIDSALMLKTTELQLDAWVFPDRNRARAYLRALKSRAGTTKLYRPERRSLVWGQGAPQVEAAAYLLRIGEISQPIPIEGQYLLMRLAGKKKLPIGNDQTDQLRKEVKDILRARKESAAIDSFIHRLMHANAMHIARPAFDRMVDAIAAATINDKTPAINAADTLLKKLDERQVRLIRRQLSDLLSAPLVRFDDGTVWTVGATVGKLAVSPFRLPDASSPHFTNALRTTLRRIAELDYMAKEAEKLGLKDSDYVATQIRMWRDALLTQKVLQEINSSLDISHQEVKTYYQSHRQEFRTPPMVNLDQIIVSDSRLAKRIRHELGEGQDFTRIAKKYAGAGTIENQRIETGYITYGTLGPLADAVRKAKIGDIIGPMPFESKYVIVKMKAKKPASYQELAEVSKAIVHKMRIEKLSDKLDELLTHRLKESRISLNRSAIDTLHLEPTGAVVIKSHFPGRMLAPIAYPFDGAENYYHLFKRNFVN